MLNVNPVSAPFRVGAALPVRVVLLIMLVFPCSLPGRMNSNTAAVVSLAGNGPDTPISICRALIAAATDSIRKGSRCMTSATHPPFQLLTDVVGRTAHHCCATRCRRRRIEPEM
jgi:hypothetical protein